MAPKSRSTVTWTGPNVEERVAGWAYVNMSESGTTCPEGMAQQTYSGLTLCGRNTTGGAGSECSVLHARSELFQSMWTTKRIPTKLTECIWMVLTVSMLMGHPSHMGVAQESTFGHTQMDMIFTLQYINSGHVLAIQIVPTPFLHTLEMTTIVRQV